MANENLRNYLIDAPGKNFVLNLTYAVYEWSQKIPNKYIDYRIFDEVSIREETDQKTKFDLEYKDHFRFDCVFFVAPGYRALNQGQTFTVGVELKNSKEDLMHDKKIEHYLGYTDYFFIGVPEYLAEHALQRAEKNAQIGVFAVNTGQIYKLPERIQVAVEHQRDLLVQIMFSRMFNQDFKSSVHFKVDDIEITRPTFKPVADDIATINQTPSSAGNVAEPVTLLTSPSAGSGRSEEDRETEKQMEKQKEQQRQERHTAKVAAIKQELAEMNDEVSDVIVSALDGLSLGDQRVYHAIRKNGAVQAQEIASLLPHQDGIRQPSIATVKRSIASLTDAGLIEREGGKKFGKYVVRQVSCDDNSCQVCAKSPFCPQYIKPNNKEK